MKVKLAFVLGAGLGYLVGTRSGRAHYDQLKAWALDVWHDPRVQEYVDEVQVQAAQFAREQGAVLKEKAASALGDRAR